jgi:hypothetical protein
MLRPLQRLHGTLVALHSGPLAPPTNVLCHDARSCPSAPPAADAAAAAAAPASEADDWDEDGGSPREENTGQWSPEPLGAALIPPGADIVHEDDDARLLELMRAQASGKQLQSCVCC